MLYLRPNGVSIVKKRFWQLCTILLLATAVGCSAGSGTDARNPGSAGSGSTAAEGNGAGGTGDGQRETQEGTVPTAGPGSTGEGTAMPAGNLELATVGGGCFWCTESVFLQLKGVRTVVSGYSGGDVDNPTYEQVCLGITNHAEVIQIAYDPTEISYEDLLHVFFIAHDPTTKNRQGADTGTQYRSVIFYHSDAQRQTAEKVIAELNKSGEFARDIVTEVSPFTKFYKAEEYHQDYFNRNPDNPYCLFNIPPKLEKLKKKFANKVNTGESN